MKRCFKCRKLKPVSEFYRHPKMRDGYLGKCKVCTRSDVQDNRARNRQRYAQYDRWRYYENPERKASVLTKRRSYLKRKAEWTVKNAIRDGRLERQPCEVCGGTPGHAHHDDYNQPLVVRWLCSIHHGMAHRVDSSRRTSRSPF